VRLLGRLWTARYGLQPFQGATGGVRSNRHRRSAARAVAGQRKSTRSPTPAGYGARCEMPALFPVILGRRNRKRAIRYDKNRYRGRRIVENAFCRLKDLRRIATRYDKLAANFLSAVGLVTAVAFWL
jgi:transposase